MSPSDVLKPMGDRAVVVPLGERIDDATFQRVQALSRKLEAEPFEGLMEFVPAYTAVTIYYDPLQLSLDDAGNAINRLLLSTSQEQPEPTRLVEIPVCYGGECGCDLEHVAEHNGLTTEEVIGLHSNADYRVHMLGFVPGFPYLGGMSERIATPRRDSPRLTTPAGSVAIGGSQTGVYPLETPGGWQIIGRTPLQLFRPGESPPTLLRAGDVVRFRPITRQEYDASTPKLPSRSSARPPGNPSLRVLRPGMLTTVQDLGRRGLQRYGVVAGGAMDAISLRVANLLVGNEETAAALETTLLGPTLRFEKDSLIAICGGDFSPRVEGAPVPMNRPVWLPKGATLALGAARQGCRAYVAIAGGIEVPEVLGGRGTYLRAGLGGHEGRALLTDDQLVIGTPSADTLSFATYLAAQKGDARFATVRWQAGVQIHPAARAELRIVRGAEFDSLTPESRATLFSSDFEVTPRSDRMAYRLAGPKLEIAASRDMLSAGVCPGTIQLPPDGQPILLMTDCATTGGYPKVAHIASVDLPLAAQLRPGDFLRLREILVAEAHNLYRQQEADLRWLKTGLRLRFARPIA